VVYYGVVHRTRVILDDRLYAALRARAKQEGRSQSAVVRGILAAHFKAQLRRIQGIARGPRNLARRHDCYLYGWTRGS
jgi:plasmid stability protein